MSKRVELMLNIGRICSVIELTATTFFLVIYIYGACSDNVLSTYMTNTGVSLWEARITYIIFAIIFLVLFGIIASSLLLSFKCKYMLLRPKTRRPFVILMIVVSALSLNIFYILGISFHLKENK